MILRLSNVLRVAFIVIAFVFAMAISYLSIRNAQATHFASLQTAQDYARATDLEPGNPRNWYLRGRFWQYNLDEPDLPFSIRAYNISLSLNPRSADTWLDLAAAYEAEGDTKAARDAFVAAKRAYPLSAETAWRYGNFLLRQGQGELTQAFREIRQAVALDHQRAAEAFSRCWRAAPDAPAILDHVLPASRDVYVDVIRDLSAAQLPDPALLVWARLVGLHSRIEIRDAFPLVDMLVHASRWPDAVRVWSEAVALAELNAPPSQPGSLIWDGGFETAVRGGGFAWDVPSMVGGVQFRLDTAEKHSGAQSLRVAFDGKSNVSLEAACGSAIVEPGRTYLFSAWLHTKALTTDEGVRFRLRGRSGYGWKIDHTAEVHGSEPWTRIEKLWTADRDTHEFRACVAREPSGLSDNQIQGTAWIDDVALIPQIPGNPKP